MFFFLDDYIFVKYILLNIKKKTLISFKTEKQVQNAKIMSSRTHFHTLFIVKKIEKIIFIHSVTQTILFYIASYISICNTLNTPQKKLFHHYKEKNFENQIYPL